MLKKRVLTALFGIPLLIAAIWFVKPLPWFTILVAIWGLLAVFEFYRLGISVKMPPLTYFGLVWTLLFIISPHFNYDLAIPLLRRVRLVSGRPRPHGEGIGVGA